MTCQSRIQAVTRTLDGASVPMATWRSLTRERCWTVQVFSLHRLAGNKHSKDRAARTCTNGCKGCCRSLVSTCGSSRPDSGLLWGKAGLNTVCDRTCPGSKQEHRKHTGAASDSGRQDNMAIDECRSVVYRRNCRRVLPRKHSPTASAPPSASTG
jgi:hypothetical protein